jgi:DNA-directed RNA polymerase specialized sigma24 family protein
MFAFRTGLKRLTGPVLSLLSQHRDPVELSDPIHDRLQQDLRKIAEEEEKRGGNDTPIVLVARMQAVVDTLPVRQRTVLLAHIEEGLNYKQIARKYGLTHRIALRDLTRAYATLRVAMGDDLE